MLCRLYAMLPSSSSPSLQPTHDETNSNIIRIGIIGASSIAKHAIIYPSTHYHHTSSNQQNENNHNIPKIQIRAIAARDISKAQSYAQQNNIPVIHSTYQNLLSDPTIDAVYIGIITELHYSIALQAIQNQKHVFIEKPAVLSLKECEKLMEEAHLNNVVLFEGFHWKYHPAAKYVTNLLQDTITKEWNGDDNNNSIIGKIKRVELVSAMFDLQSWIHPLEGERGRVKLYDRWCYLVDELHHFLSSSYDKIDKVLDYDIQHVNLSTKRVQVNMTGILNDKHQPNENNNNTIEIYLDAYKDKLELPKWYFKILGTNGSITFHNVIFPFIYHAIEIENYGSKDKKIVKIYKDDNGKGGTTFDFQFDEFVKIVNEKKMMIMNANNLHVETLTSTFHSNDESVIMNQMVKNVKLYERIVSFTGQDHLKSW